MTKIVAYLPTYSPETEADTTHPRPSSRLSQAEIVARFKFPTSTLKPWMYLDSIDSILNICPDIKLMVADGRSTESVRDALKKHNEDGGYELKLYPDRMSQWLLFNDIFKDNQDSDYFVYTSSDVVWTMDWVAEAIKEFDKNPKLQILFPCVNKGDVNLPSQLANGPRDIDPIVPPFQSAARAPVLNAYAMIFRMDLLRAYGGYPTVFRNCFTESFLAYMCEAIGGEMRILPRGWCFHWSEGDKWLTPGSAYYYTEEKMEFQSIMDQVLMRRAMKMMTKDYLKSVLYKKD